MRDIPRAIRRHAYEAAGPIMLAAALFVIVYALSGCAAFEAWDSSATPAEREQAASAAEGAAATVGGIGAAAGPAGAIIAAPFGVALMLLAARIRRGPKPDTTTPSTGDGQ